LTGPVFHLAEPDAWQARTEVYRAASLEEEGFIHCSTAGQLDGVAPRLYEGRNDLVLLTIDPSELGDSLVHEDLYQLGEVFPHIYGAVPLRAVVATGPYLKHLEQGLWQEETRFDRSWMDRILHPDFTEVGRSGHTYTRTEILTTPRVALDVPIGDDYRLVSIDDEVAMARYVSYDSYDGVDQNAHRTSIWVRTDSGWRLRFHQGTSLPETANR
jgi:uncharacterized protein (DUF952 family)